MITSQKTVVESAVSSPVTEGLPSGVLAYISARNRGHFFDYVHTKLREAEGRGLTRKVLANRIGKSPTRLSHILGSPGNWTLDTVSILLLGIAAEEVVPNSRPVLGRPRRNFDSQAEVEAPKPLPRHQKASGSANVQEKKLEPVL